MQSGSDAESDSDAESGLQAREEQYNTLTDLFLSTEVWWEFPHPETVNLPFCSSVFRFQQMSCHGAFIRAHSYCDAAAVRQKTSISSRQAWNCARYMRRCLPRRHMSCQSRVDFDTIKEIYFKVILCVSWPSPQTLKKTDSSSRSRSVDWQSDLEIIVTTLIRASVWRVSFERSIARTNQQIFAAAVTILENNFIKNFVLSSFLISMSEMPREKSTMWTNERLSDLYHSLEWTVYHLLCDSNLSAIYNCELRSISKN